MNNIIRDPGNIFDSLGVALPNSSNFFINYITLRAFCLVPFQLLIPHPGVWHYLFQFGGHLGFARTKRAFVQLFTPRSVRYIISNHKLLISNYYYNLDMEGNMVYFY